MYYVLSGLACIFAVIAIIIAASSAIELVHLTIKLWTLGLDDAGDWYSNNNNKAMGNTLKALAWGDKAQKGLIIGGLIGQVIGIVLILVFAILFILSLGQFQKKWIFLIWICVVLAWTGACMWTVRYMAKHTMDEVIQALTLVKGIHKE